MATTAKKVILAGRICNIAGSAAFTWAKEGQEFGGMHMSCENMGFVWAYFNGNSKDELVHTLAKWLHDFDEGLGIQIQVYHLRRRKSWETRKLIISASMKCRK